MAHPTNNEVVSSLHSPEGDLVECTSRLQFSTTNIEAEFEVVLLGIKLAKATGALSVVIHSNSQVIIGHINGDYKAKGERNSPTLDLDVDFLSSLN